MSQAENTNSTNPLLKLSESEIDGAAVQTVNARDLHAFLEVKSEFRNWIKNRIDDFGFRQDVDFVAGKFLPGSEQVDYFLTLDMAKELSMVERNAKGKQARLYFIECERRAKAPAIDPMRVLNDPAAMRGLLLTYSEKVLNLEAANAAMKEDVNALATIAKSEGSVCMTDAAKALQQRPKDLIDYLKAHGWIYRRAGGDHWVAYQNRIQAGDLEHKVTTVLRADGTEKITEQVKVTPRGLAKLAKLFPPPLKVA